MVSHLSTFGCFTAARRQAQGRWTPGFARFRRFALHLLAMSVLLCAHSNARDISVNYLTSLHTNGPAGWPNASHPQAPPLYAEDGQLYFFASGSVYTLPPTPSHYSRTELLGRTTIELTVLPGAPVQSALTGHFHGSAYAGVATSSYVSEVVQGGVFRTEFDGTVPELISAGAGNVVHPNGVVVLDSEDNLYGLDLGPENNGRVFKISATGEFSVLHEFGPGPDGQRQFPNGMMLGSDGRLYGVTAYQRGIPYLDTTPTDPGTPVGTLYRLSPDTPGSLEILHTFVLSEGEIPWYDLSYNGAGQAQLPSNGATLTYVVEGGDGYLYGATSIGTCNTRGVNSNGESTTRTDAPLCGGDYTPYSSLDGSDLFGTPYPHYDGPNPHGSLYRLRLDGSDFTLLHRFSGEDGSQPRGPMVIAPDGRLYGTTLSGGANQSENERFEVGETYPGSQDRLTYDGTLYRLHLAAIAIDDNGDVIDSGFEHLHSFKGGIVEDSDGKVPTGLALGGNGRLYGSTLFGGRGYISANGREWQNDNSGTVFEVDLLGDIPAASVTVTAAPGAIAGGENADITWTSDGASNCIATGGAEGDSWSGAREPAGSMVVSPAAGIYYYTLTCDDDRRGGQVAAVITLRVDAETVIDDGNTASYGNGGGAPGAPLLALLLTLMTRLARRNKHPRGDG